MIESERKIHPPEPPSLTEGNGKGRAAFFNFLSVSGN